MKQLKWIPIGKKTAAIQAAYHKEFADYFCNLRFFLVLVILLATGVVGAWGAMQTIAAYTQTYSSDYVFLYLFTGSNGILPSLVNFFSYLCPIVGIVLGFDAISSERNSGTLSRILSMPIYRDTLVNVKALAGIRVIGIIAISVCGIVTGIGILVCGIVPLPAELVRIFLFILFTTVYAAFWLCLAILCSIVFRQATVSALSGIFVWVTGTVFVPIFAQTVAAAVYPVHAGSLEQTIYSNEQLYFLLMKLSPSNLYTEAVTILLNPMIRSAGPISNTQFEGMVPGFLSISQSLMLIWAQLAGLIALGSICFAIAYILFAKQEIRA